MPLSTSNAVADTVGAPRSVSASLRQAPLFYGIFTLQNRDRNRRRIWRPAIWLRSWSTAQVLNGIITPLLLTYVLIPGQQIQRARLGEERAGVQDDRHDL
ncbi:MAG: hypothetical protein QOI29_2070 [Mycobacterium sp.]|nr:hypothetical protein [Mycobacterium sp.]